MKRLYRTEGEAAMLGGVCGGLAEYFDLDPGLVRILTAAMLLAGGLSFWVYLVAVLVLPKKSQVFPLD